MASLLAGAGHEVHFVARGLHLDAMRKTGLQIRSILGDFRIQPVQATDQPSEIGPVDLALFCTKAFSTEAAAQQSKPIIGAGTTILSLQNGVEAPDQLPPILGPEHVLAGATWLSSFIEAPGIIRHVSDSRRVVLGELDGSHSERLDAINRALADAGVSAEISYNIRGVLWAKLVFISAVAGVGSLTRLPMAAYRSVAETRRLVVDMMQETTAVAASLGVRLDADTVERALQYMDNARPDVKASMQLDFEAGRPTELDALIGVIVAQGSRARRRLPPSHPPSTPSSFRLSSGALGVPRRLRYNSTVASVHPGDHHGSSAKGQTRLGGWRIAWPGVRRRPCARQRRLPCRHQ